MASPHPTSPFLEARLRQIARLVHLQQDHSAEFNAWGTRSVRHAIFSMVLDCREGGVPRARLDAALTASDEPRVSPPGEQRAA